jgi:hypothetical protein
MPMQVARVLDDAQIGQAWEMYTVAFAELRAAAVQRHVMNRREFDQVMADERVAKYLAIDPATDRLAGLATLTNDLDAMPLVSPDFFERRWPDLFAQRKVWYLGFFAIEPAYRGTGTFEEVIAEMWTEVRAGGGLAALDICGQNSAIGLPRAIQRTLEGLTPQVKMEQIDVQTYWAFELETTE